MSIDYGLVFGILRKYIDHNVPIRICDLYTGLTEDYENVEEIPAEYGNRRVKEIGIIPFKFRIHGIHGYGDLSYALEVRLEDDGFIKDFVPWSDLYRCIEFVS